MHTAFVLITSALSLLLLALIVLAWALHKDGKETDYWSRSL